MLILNMIKKLGNRLWAPTTQAIRVLGPLLRLQVVLLNPLPTPIPGPRLPARPAGLLFTSLGTHLCPDRET